MTSQRTAPYGAWRSPITAELTVRETVSFADTAVDSTGIYWSEVRPSEEGRYVIVRYADGKTEDIIQPPFSARTRVHEYGGGAFTVHNGTVFFSNFSDQRLFRKEPGMKPVPLSPEGGYRYADACFDPHRNRLVLVREDHTRPGEAMNTLVCIDTENGSAGETAAEGHDFCSSPCISPDGSRMAWLVWDHPNMPWDGTMLIAGDITAQGTVENVRTIAGGREESVFQPRFSPRGTLYFVSDPEGWWNIYRYNGTSAECVYRAEAEFGLPQWVFGMSTYDFLSEDRIICAYARNGVWNLGIIDTQSGACTGQDTGFSAISSVHAANGKAVFTGGSPRNLPCMVLFDPETENCEIIRRSCETEIPEKYISIPEPVSFASGDGEARAFHYPPRNDDVTAPEDELPPCIVMIHGGPTSASAGTLSPRIQYWTSRGFGVLDVNYRGSTGFGRKYRDLLKGRWGVADTEDCVNGAEYLAAQGLADRNRAAIRGGSAGGYTALCALTFYSVFSAGASYYGVSDTEILAQETHKFESRYLDRLIGPYPEARDIYVKRSPIHYAEKLSSPVIFFQGLEDEIVPPNQAEMMVQALRKNGVPVAYCAFEGEQHGFRKSETIVRTLEAELYFYSRIFGFTPADDIEPIEIENLDMK